jgi:PAS domain S-box-containing protein
MEKYKILFDASPDPIFVENYDGIILEANDAACIFHGVSRTELIGKHFIDFVPKKFQTKIQNNFETFIKNKQTILKSHAVNSFGESIPIEITVNNIVFNKEPSILLHIRDISRRVFAENEYKRSQEDLRKLSAHLQHIREMESAKIARELHDGLGQDLTALKFNLSLLKKKFDQLYIEVKEKTELDEKINITYSLSETLLENIRKITNNLRPTILDNLGLVAAMEWMVEDFRQKTGIDCELHIQVNHFVYDSSTETAIYRIIQESLTNIFKHAEATKTSLSFVEFDKYYEIQIKDDGKGFSQLENYKKADSLGIISMNERALGIQSQLIIKSKPQKGTTITLQIPKTR